MDIKANASIENAMKYSFASLWDRILAFALDYIPIAGYITLLVIIGVTVNRTVPALASRLFGNPILGQLIGFLFITLPVSLYFSIGESSTRQATWGKLKMGLMVTRSYGARLSHAHALGRTALKFIPWELAHTCIWQISFQPRSDSPLILAGFVLVWILIGANVISLLVSKSHQTVYDRLAGTFVLKAYRKEYSHV